MPQSLDDGEENSASPDDDDVRSNGCSGYQKKKKVPDNEDGTSKISKDSLAGVTCMASSSTTCFLLLL